MYLSRIEINTACRSTMKALVSPSIFHGAIESANLVDRSRKLWRIDTLNGKSYLLILSEGITDWSSVVAQFGFEGDNYESKDYSRLLEQAKTGTKWRFRLRANPTISQPKPEEKRGKVLAHVSEKFQSAWLQSRGEKNGFSVQSDEFLVTQSQWYAFHKNGNGGKRVRLLAVTYEGILTITDQESFRNALTQGIGREKAYGMGMLTIVRVG